MKRTNLIYWIFTILFGAFMLFSAIPNVLLTPESVAFITGLGYPKYIIFFLGIAKTLGVIGILIPGFPRLKEWAYAGLFFDITGATWSVISFAGPDPQQFFMVLPFTLEAVSYIYYHKRLKERQS
jgi:uncharacterized membrane protein YphA (DoxX/SURF4 family)